MLQIIFKTEEKHPDPEITASRTVEGNVTWTKGADFPQMVPGTTVEKLAADGDELDLICQLFRNIPTCAKFTAWEQPFADFIYTNLLYSLKK